MFEPFFTTKTETGTGLGLWVVAQLLERHKGSVRVWSSQRIEASGTAFSVFLPFGEAVEDQPSSDDGAGAVNGRAGRRKLGNLRAWTVSNSPIRVRGVTDSGTPKSRFFAHRPSLKNVWGPVLSE